MASKISYELENGQLMPALGFGTWQATGDDARSALEAALEAGYRHIDTATVYENEKMIGQVLNEWITSGKVTREELFVTTKLPPCGNRPSGVEKWIKKSLEDLQLDYLDMYLIHTPFAFVEVEGDLHPMDDNGEIRIDPSTDHVAVWREMEEQVALGRAKAIGLSNFNVEQIERVIQEAKLPIYNLQIELQLYFQQQELVDYCKEKGIIVTAYSPLGNRGFFESLGCKIPNSLEHPAVTRIAEKHGKTAAQVILRHIVQKGASVIPKSVNPQRIKENIDIFDFELDDEDAEDLNAVDCGPSGRICDFSFIKGIQKHPEFPL